MTKWTKITYNEYEAKEFLWVDNVNLTVPWFLMASYLYYIEDVPLLHDWEYDKLCRYMLQEWDRIEHWHKHLVNKESLNAGTGFYLKEADYPMRVKCAAIFLARERCIL